MFLMDSFMVYDVTAKVLGQLVAACMVLIGACGAYGSHKRSRNLLNLHIVGVVLAIMLGVQYITAFSRDNYVNCSMARLYVRVLHIVSKPFYSSPVPFTAEEAKAADKCKRIPDLTLCSFAFGCMLQTQKIQSFLEKQPSVTMFTTVVARINEMEDMLHNIEEGSVENLQKKINVSPPPAPPIQRHPMMAMQPPAKPSASVNALVWDGGMCE